MKLPDSNPAEGRFVLHYNPSRAATAYSAAALEMHFGAFMTMFLIVCVVIALAAAACLEIRMWPLLLLLIPIAVLPFIFMDVCRPTNVELGPQGIRLHCLHPLLFLSGPWISWSVVEFADYVDGKVSGIPRRGKCFDLTLDLSQLTSSQKRLMETLCATVTTSCDNVKLTIRLLESGFFIESDQDSIRHLLYKHMPAERINSSLVARLEFGEVPAYTALWLDRLNAQPGAERSTVPDATRLADGKYEVVCRLGSGGQAVVYDAIALNANASDHSEQRCVLKEFVLPVRGGIEIKQRAVDNIQREAGLLKSLCHPHIVRYKDLFIEGPRAYLVMERVDGVPLNKVIDRDGPMGTVQVIQLAREMCGLMAYLHEQTPPVVHRDFTPENLMLCGDNHITLIDFNVAQRLESTSTKTVVGKHAYVPPEQFRGKPTIQSDIYAFGATLYFLLTGEEPEPITKADPRCKNKSVDVRVADVVARATEPELEARYANVSEIQTDLSAIAC